MKPKRAYAAGKYKPNSIDDCQTPSYAIDPLIPYIPKEWAIWECAAGEGRLVGAFERAGYQVIGSDIAGGENFFDIEADGIDIICSNPPYGCKFDFIERAYNLGKPFAFLVPVETIGSKRCQAMMQQHGVELLLLNRRVDFYMPFQGNAGSAQFPVMWFCHGLLPATICYGDLIKTKDTDGIEVEA